MKSGLIKTGLRGVLLMCSVALTNCALAQVISTYAGNGDRSPDNKTATKVGSLKLDNAGCAVADKKGNLYFADVTHNFIYKAGIDGSVSVIAGNGSRGYSADGTAATAAYLNQPSGIAVGKDGCVYFAEYENNCVRKITPDGTLTTVAGNAASGYSGNGGKALQAKLHGPTGIAFDKNGDLYVSEAENNCVRKVSSATGIISLFAGNAAGYGTGRGTYSGDGAKAVAAGLNQPGAIAFDNAGNLYIVDCFNHCIRKVNLSGVISTFAGTGEAGFNGDSGPGRTMKLNYPSGIACDNAGNVYISDFGNNKVRMVSVGGILTTVAGNGQPAFGGDGGLAIYAGIGKPSFVVADAGNRLFIGDRSNHRIRVMDQQPAQPSVTNSTAGSTHAIIGSASSADASVMQ